MTKSKNKNGLDNEKKKCGDQNLDTKVWGDLVHLYVVSHGTRQKTEFADDPVCVTD